MTHIFFFMVALAWGGLCYALGRTHERRDWNRLLMVRPSRRMKGGW